MAWHLFALPSDPMYYFISGVVGVAGMVSENRVGCRFEGREKERPMTIDLRRIREKEEKT